MSKEKNGVKVIGIDPAPGKESVVYDGECFEKHSAECLDAYLAEMRRTCSKLLICWDAPLTGPKRPDGFVGKGDLTMRLIEKLFLGKEPCPTPKGISVLGYAACQHWTISRRLLGLPIIGRYDCRDLPFRLLHEKPETWNGDYIVEVHSAVAIWVWLKDTLNPDNNDWRYKNMPPKATKEEKENFLKNRKEMYESIVGIAGKFGFDNLEKNAHGKKNITDDQLDASVAWLLGKLWVSTKGNEGDVRILGNSCTGSFLLPYHGDVFGKWKDYCSKQKKRICPNEKA